MKFIIFAPKFQKRNHAGVLALYDLNQSLQSLGYDSRVMEWENMGSYDPKSLVVYPEVVTDNPLNAARVIRYFLHIDGYIAGRRVQLGANDFLLTWSELYHSAAHAVLYKFFVGPEFNDHNTKSALDRSLDCTWFHKARYHQDATCVPGTVNIGADGALTRPALADLLRQTRILYTYDPLSQLVYEAIFCGALVVPLRWQPFSADQIQSHSASAFPHVALHDDKICIPMDYNEQRQEFITRLEQTNKNYSSRLLKVVDQIRNHFHITE